MKEETEVREVIILKGPPGVGKSYTAKKLISKLKNNKVALLPVDEVLHFDLRPLCDDKLKLAKFHIALIARNFLLKGFDIVIEYTFDKPEHLKFMIDEIERNHLEDIPKREIHIFHLTARIDEVIKRNSSRKDGTDPLPIKTLKKLYAACEETIGKVRNEILIDTSKLTVGKVTAKILESIK